VRGSDRQARVRDGLFQREHGSNSGGSRRGLRELGRGGAHTELHHDVHDQHDHIHDEHDDVHQYHHVHHDDVHHHIHDHHDHDDQHDDDHGDHSHHDVEHDHDDPPDLPAGQRHQARDPHHVRQRALHA